MTTTPGHGPLPGGILSSASIGPSGVSISIVVIALSNCSRDVRRNRNFRPARARWLHMMRRLLLTYAVVELIVLIGLAATIGVGWTLLVLLATFVLGLVLWAPLAGWQLSSQIAQLRSGLKDPRA